MQLCFDFVIENVNDKLSQFDFYLHQPQICQMRTLFFFLSFLGFFRHLPLSQLVRTSDSRVALFFARQVYQ